MHISFILSLQNRVLCVFVCFEDCSSWIKALQCHKKHRGWRHLYPGVGSDHEQDPGHGNQLELWERTPGLCCMQGYIQHGSQNSFCLTSNSLFFSTISFQALPISLKSLLKSVILSSVTLMSTPKHSLFLFLVTSGCTGCDSSAANTLRLQSYASCKSDNSEVK